MCSRSNMFVWNESDTGSMDTKWCASHSRQMYSLCQYTNHILVWAKRIFGSYVKWQIAIDLWNISSIDSSSLSLSHILPHKKVSLRIKYFLSIQKKKTVCHVTWIKSSSFYFMTHLKVFTVRKDNSTLSSTGEPSASDRSPDDE